MKENQVERSNPSIPNKIVKQFFCLVPISNRDIVVLRGTATLIDRPSSIRSIQQFES